MIVVTRHKSLVEYLRQEGIIDDNCTVIEHASPAEVRGQHVVGVVPLRLAALAASVTEIPLDIPAELRGTELGIEDIRRYAGKHVTYRVEEMS